MSVTVVSTLTCDICGAQWMGQENEGASALRARARDTAGWRFLQKQTGEHPTRDACPDCWANRPLDCGRHPSRVATEERRARVYALWRAGRTRAEISAEVGVTPTRAQVLIEEARRLEMFARWKAERAVGLPLSHLPDDP